MNESKLLKPIVLVSTALYFIHVMRFVLFECCVFCTVLMRSVLFQCRERGSSYLGSLSISMLWKVNGRIQGTVERKIADVPIMVKVRLCHVMYIVHKQVLYSLYIYYSLLYMHTRYKFEVFGDTTLCFHNIDFIILNF